MRGTADILRISKSINLLVKMKNMFFILWKKTYKLFGQSNILLIELKGEIEQYLKIVRYFNMPFKVINQNSKDTGKLILSINLT